VALVVVMLFRDSGDEDAAAGADDFDRRVEELAQDLAAQHTIRGSHPEPFVAQVKDTVDDFEEGVDVVGDQQYSESASLALLIDQVHHLRLAA
jgi:NADPH:quinone reductase-like Zn-dependent oxidoreductase